MDGSAAFCRNGSAAPAGAASSGGSSSGRWRFPSLWGEGGPSLGRASLHRSGRGSLSAAIGGNREGVPSLGREKNFFRLARKRAKNGGVRPLRGRRPAGGAKMAPEDPRRSLLIRFPGRGSFRRALAGHCQMSKIFHRFEVIPSLPPLPGNPPVSSPKKGRNGKSGRQTAAAF